VPLSHQKYTAEELPLRAPSKHGLYGCGSLLGAQHLRHWGGAVGGGRAALVGKEGRAPLEAQQVEHLVVVAHFIVGSRQQLVPGEDAVGSRQKTEGLQSERQ